jgi:hypothetical protein
MFISSTPGLLDREIFNSYQRQEASSSVEYLVSCNSSRIYQVLLFEKATFLVVAHHMRKEHNDGNRFEKISNIIKQFKLSCNKMQSFFRSIEVDILRNCIVFISLNSGELLKFFDFC